VPRVALAMSVAFAIVAFGWRAWLQHRRTGDYGVRGFSGPRGSVEWFGGVIIAVGATLAATAPVAQLVGLVAPFAAIDRPWVNRLGLLLALMGVAVTIVAQLQMRDSWRVGVDSREVTPLVTVGLFSIVRNPIYSGVLLAIAGLLLMAPNLLSVVAAGTLLVGIQIQVRRVEEPHLTRVHGESYRAYGRTVGRFLPRMGRLFG
jgi:protein-S-isoprenylcysteine O-methyltransferase Ste14